jgi:hypothetical protein
MTQRQSLQGKIVDRGKVEHEQNCYYVQEWWFGNSIQATFILDDVLTLQHVHATKTSFFTA